MSVPHSTWKSVFESHLNNLRTHRSMLEDMVGLFSQSDAELEAMCGRADQMLEDAVRAGNLLDGARDPSAKRVYTPASTPNKRRRISNGAMTERPGSPDMEEPVEQLTNDAEAKTNKRIVVGNIPVDTSENDLLHHFRNFDPIKMGNSIRRPKRSEVHLYALPSSSLYKGFIKLDLPSAATAARAADTLDHTRLKPHHADPLIVRKYRESVSTKKAVQKRRVSSSSSAATSTEPHRKRQRTGQAPLSMPPYPLTPVSAATVAETQPQPQQEPEQEPVPFAVPEAEFEDIRAEVEARLMEQAAKRAAAKPKAGRKRKRISGASLTEATCGVRELGLEKEMELRPKKRARDEAMESGNRAEMEMEVEMETEAVVGGVPNTQSRSRRRKERKRVAKERPDGGPRPQKRWRGEQAVNGVQ